MGLKKGMTNNPAGRPKGTPNKITVELRERIKTLIEENWEQLSKDIKKLTPKERLTIIEKFIQYYLPKPQTISFQSDFEKLTDEQLDYIIEQLKNSQDEQAG